MAHCYILSRDYSKLLPDKASEIFLIFPRRDKISVSASSEGNKTRCPNLKQDLDPFSLQSFLILIRLSPGSYTPFCFVPTSLPFNSLLQGLPGTSSQKSHFICFQGAFLHHRTNCSSRKNCSYKHPCPRRGEKQFRKTVISAPSERDKYGALQLPVYPVGPKFLSSFLSCSGPREPVRNNLFFLTVLIFRGMSFQAWRIRNKAGEANKCHIDKKDLSFAGCGSITIHNGETWLRALGSPRIILSFPALLQTSP